MKDCPDLTKLSAEQKLEFWQSADPRSLKRVGDRLLAESLPHVEATRPRDALSQEVAAARADLGWTIEKLSESLGVTPDMLQAWENDRVRPPECLPMVLKRLKALAPTDSE